MATSCVACYLSTAAYSSHEPFIIRGNPCCNRHEGFKAVMVLRRLYPLSNALLEATYTLETIMFARGIINTSSRGVRNSKVPGQWMATNNKNNAFSALVQRCRALALTPPNHESGPLRAILSLLYPLLSLSGCSAAPRASSPKVGPIRAALLRGVWLLSAGHS